MLDEFIDPDILQEFVDESLDSLEDLPQLFIKLEKNPDSKDIVNAIFRPVHSIKGNSAFFGLLKLKKLTHELETTLDKCRKEELVANKEIINILLKGLDKVSDIFTRVRNRESEIGDEKSYNALLSEIKNVYSQTAQNPNQNSSHADINNDLLLEKLTKVKNATVLSGTHEQILLQEVIDLLSSAVSTEESFKEDELSIYEKILTFLEKDIEETLPDSEVDKFEEMLIELKTQLITTDQLELFNTIYDDFKTFSETVGFDSLLADLLKEKLLKIGSDTLQSEPLTQEEPEEQLEIFETAFPEKDVKQVETKVEASKNSETEKSDDTSASKDVAAKTMRVPENTIDEFLNFVGELVVVREMYDHLRLHYEDQGVANELTSELRRNTDTFRQVSGELERTCMNIRKQPIKQILRKLPRIVRDVAGTTGKEIDVEIFGDETQVDKSLVGIIEDPLVHMIRNAADHGIEIPEERVKAGKSKSGKIVLTVTEDEESLYVSIKDDGKGLNYPTLLEKGIKMGLFHEGQNPSQSEIAQVIFMSGVSTAKEITDISGRGVGMDVVKRYIENAGGSVTITSETGKGSEFNITLRKSVTTQIINGLVFRLDGICYVIPLKYVVENFPPEADKFCNVFDKHEYVKRHNKLLRVIRLSELFSDSVSEERSHETGILIVIEANGSKIALLADEVVNIQQVVLKPLKGLHMKKEYFCGGALRGDGYISLILDIEHLLKGIQLNYEESERLNKV